MMRCCQSGASDAILYEDFAVPDTLEGRFEMIASPRILDHASPEERG